MFSQAVGQTWPPSSKGSVNLNRTSPYVCSNAADVPGEIPVLGQQDPMPRGGCSMRDLAAWWAWERWVDGASMCPWIITWSLVILRTKWRLCIFIFIFISYSFPQVLVMLCCISSRRPGAAWPWLSQALLSLGDDSRLCSWGLNPRASQNPNNTSLWVSVSVGAFSNITLVL